MNDVFGLGSFVFDGLAIPGQLRHDGIDAGDAPHACFDLLDIGFCL